MTHRRLSESRSLSESESFSGETVATRRNLLLVVGPLTSGFCVDDTGDRYTETRCHSVVGSGPRRSLRSRRYIVRPLCLAVSPSLSLSHLVSRQLKPSRTVGPQQKDSDIQCANHGGRISNVTDSVQVRSYFGAASESDSRRIRPSRPSGTRNHFYRFD